MRRILLISPHLRARNWSKSSLVPFMICMHAVDLHTISSRVLHFSASQSIEKIWHALLIWGVSLNYCSQYFWQSHMYNDIVFYSSLCTGWVPRSQRPTRYVNWLQNLTRSRIYLPPLSSELGRAQHHPLRADI